MKKLITLLIIAAFGLLFRGKAQHIEGAHLAGSNLGVADTWDFPNWYCDTNNNINSISGTYGNIILTNCPVATISNTALTTIAGTLLDQGSNLKSAIFTGLTTAYVFDLDNNGGLTNVSVPNLQLVTGQLNVYDNPLLPQLIMTNLLNVTGNQIQISAQLGPSNVDMRNLTNCSGVFYMGESTNLTNFNITALVSVPNNFLFVNGLSNLVNFTLPALHVLNAQGLDLQNCKLSAASINSILAQLVTCVLPGGGTWVGTAKMQGGGNAAPTGQGITDKATLISRGCTITTN